MTGTQNDDEAVPKNRHGLLAKWGKLQKAVKLHSNELTMMKYS